MNPGDSTSEPADLAHLAARVGAVAVRFAAGQRIYSPGEAPRGWIAVTSGRVRVGLTADTGHEVTLYRLTAGEACLLTTSALLNSDKLNAEAIAETDVEALLIPTRLFERLLAEDAEFRREALRNYAERVTDLVLLIQDTLFHALPERLARLLLQRESDGHVAATHQVLASELGTAREVVTRALSNFEREGLLEILRGRLRILDRPALERRAGERV